MQQDGWVVLSSANGSTNLGDESMWEATVQVLRQIAGPVHVLSDSHPNFHSPVPNVSLLPFLHNSLRRGSTTFPPAVERIISYPRRTDRAFKLAAHQYRNPKGDLARSWFNAISSARGLIVSGAGAMTDDYAPHGVASWWLATEWAHSHDVPVHFLGQGIGPLVDERSRRYAARMLELANTVNVRESISAEVVRGLGVRTPVTVTPDWAILNTPQLSDRAMASSIVDDWFGDSPFITLSLHRRHNTTRARLRELAQLAEGVVRLAKRKDLGVAFVPNMTGSAYSDDRSTFDLLSREWTPSLRAHVQVVREQVGPRVTRALLARSRALFSTRYHPMVFALAEGTPAVGLSYDEYYDQKLIGASSMFGVTDNVLRVSSARPEDLFETSEFTPEANVESLGMRSVEVLKEALG